MTRMLHGLASVSAFNGPRRGIARGRVGAVAVVACLLGPSWSSWGADAARKDVAAAAFAPERQAMVEQDIAARGIDDEATLRAMRAVPRHVFVPAAYVARAYDDRPLPIGHGQTISQPYIVAYMTEQLRPQPEDRVLEIGAGSGYQAAVLAEIVAEVFTMEIVAPLAEQARERLREELDYDNVSVRHGDGYHG